ncbi:hypothetical protein C5S29_10035 [ANME-1 cluster archaeon GoMg3.2]|nr:hypothetical protein [ANME-1 cluster archaeon GoMg3.2]
MMLNRAMRPTLTVRRLCRFIEVKSVPVMLLTNLSGMKNARIWNAIIDAESWTP